MQPCVRYRVLQPVKAAATGYMVDINHGNGLVYKIILLFQDTRTRKGRKSKFGEKIAEVGSTEVATGPHLHLK